MAETINGLHIEVSSTELKGLLLQRLKYHQDKLAIYTTEHEKFAKMESLLSEDARQISKVSNSRGGNPLEELKSGIKTHGDQIVYYNFMSEHVIQNATYRLSEPDLIRLGIKSDRY